MAEVKTQQNIPSGWQVLPIGKHIKLQGGNAFSASNYVSDGIPLVRIGNVGKGVFVANDFVYISEDEHANNESVHLRENDILMGMTGELGKVARIGKKHLPAILNQRVGRVVFKDNDMDPEFTFQVFLSKDFISKLEKYFIGAAQKNISSSQVESIEVLLPPIKEQQKIAGILGTVDEDIAKTQEVIDATEKLKRGLMQNILSFVNKADVKYLALGDIGKVSMCKRIFREETSVVGDIPFYKIGTFGKEPDAFISRELYDSYRKKFSFPKIGDVLLSASGTIGRRVKYDGRPAYFQDSNIIWLEHDESKILNSFLFYLYETITWQTEGSTIKRLYNSILLKKVVPVPSIGEQRKIVEILSSVDEKISVNRKLKEKLTLLKKGLMQDLLSGTVRTNI